ncbi:hypothetical protein Tco_0454731 [Tanacetum coccineum]
MLYKKIVDSWFASSKKSLESFIDCGIAHLVKLGLGHSINSNAEVLGMRRDGVRGIFVLRKQMSDGELRAVSNDSSTHYSTCQSNDSRWEWICKLDQPGLTLTGVNVNTGKQNVSSGSLHVSSGTHVNSGSLHVNSGTKFKSGASRFNPGKQHVNSGSVQS